MVYKMRKRSEFSLIYSSPKERLRKRNVFLAEICVHAMEDWMMNKRKVWFFPMVLCVLLLAVSCDEKNDPEEVVQEKTHVTELAELGNSADFSYAGTSPIVIDGKGSVIVDAWQDLWFGGDVTIKGVEFAKGVSLNARINNPCTITVEDCVIRWCDQKNDLLPEVDANPNFRIDNSGNGLCLSIDTQNKGDKFLTVNVKNCTLIGDNDPTAPRKDSYATTGFYINRDSTNFKGRGNGVGLGTASGNGMGLKQVSIEGCSFSGLRNAAIQLYTFDCPITITKCTFESWGVNKDRETDPSYAIRGNVDKVSHSGASLKVEDCTFGSDPHKWKVDFLEVTE